MRFIKGKKLLDFYLSTSSLKSCLDSFSCSLIYAFLNIARCTVYEVLSLFQTKTKSFLSSLYNAKLSSTCALQNNIERCLLFNSSTTFSGACSNSNSCSSWFDSILILEDSLKFTNFLYCQIYQFFSNSFNICHLLINFNLLFFYFFNFKFFVFKRYKIRKN